MVYSIGKGDLCTGISQESNALIPMLSENNMNHFGRATKPATACG